MRLITRVVQNRATRVLAILGAGASALALTAFAAAKEPSLLNSRVVLAVRAPCYLHCDHCQGLSQHFTHSGSENGGVEHGNCWAGGTCEAHGCGESDEDAAVRVVSVSEALKTLEAAPPEEIPGLVERYPQIFSYNEERQAIQVLNCKGDVSVHVPLSLVQLTGFN